MEEKRERKENRDSVDGFLHHNYNKKEEDKKRKG